VDQMRHFARETGFGMLVAFTPNGLSVAHVPFVFLDDERLGVHLARANPLAAHLDAADCVCVVTGPSAYISPDWYGLDQNQVPTWNYLAVELRGQAIRMDDDGLLAQIDALSQEQEHRLFPKVPWARSKMDRDVAAKMTRAIVGFEVRISAWQGTTKFNQNKPAEARLRVAEALDAAGKTAAARLMRGPPQ
jgi:transcriptional regulator